MTRRIISVFLVLAALLGLISCGEQNKEEKPVLSIWVLSDDYASYIDWTIKNYCSQNERIIEVEAVDFTQIEQKIYDSACKGKTPDIIMLPPEAIEPMAEKGMIAPLSELSSAIDENRFYDFAVNTGKVNGKLYAACWHASPGIFAYRRSIAKAYLGTDEPEAIENLMSDTDSFLEVAQLLKVSSSGNTYVLPGLGDITRAYFGGDFSSLDEEKVAGYFEFAKKLADEGYVYGAQQWSEAWAEGFNDSSTVFGYCLSDIAVRDVLFRIADESIGDWGAAVPCGNYAWGGAYLAIYSGSDDIEISSDIISLLTANESVMIKSSLYSGIFTWNKHVNRTAASDSQFQSAVFGGQNYFRTLIKAADKLSGSSLQSSDDSIAISLLNTCADNYISGEYELSAAVDTFFQSLRSYT